MKKVVNNKCLCFIFRMTFLFFNTFKIQLKNTGLFI